VQNEISSCDTGRLGLGTTGFDFGADLAADHTGPPPRSKCTVLPKMTNADAGVKIMLSGVVSFWRAGRVNARTQPQIRGLTPPTRQTDALPMGRVAPRHRPGRAV